MKISLPIRLVNSWYPHKLNQKQTANSLRLLKHEKAKERKRTTQVVHEGQQKVNKEHEVGTSSTSRDLNPFTTTVTSHKP